jgi:hypothetical protein
MVPPAKLIGGFVDAGNHLPGVYKPLTARTFISINKIA